METAITERLEHRFRTIGRERMQGLPFVHSGLEVEAVDFSAWEGGWIGALITPWSLNLVYLPGPGVEARPGRKRVIEFPAGRFTFVDSQDEELGAMATCPVFSAVTELADQAAAREAAHAAVTTLLEPEPEASTRGARPGAEGNAISRRAFLRGAVGSRRGT